MTLPGPSALALFGETVAFLRNPYESILRAYERYGPVFALGRGAFRFVYLIGPEANQLILADQPEKFRWREAFDVLTPVSGETALIVSDGAEHKRRRRLIQPAFHKKRIDAYVTHFVSEMERTLESWRGHREVNLYDDLRATIRRITTRALFGERLAKQADVIGPHLQRMLAFINRPIFLQVRASLPGTGWRALVESRAVVDRLIYEEIGRRRAAPDEGDDVMALLLSTRDEEGDQLSDQEVRDQVTSLIVAGYDTTSAAMGWALHTVLSDPGLLERARAASAPVVTEPPTLDVLARMNTLDWILNETLRLYPPAFISVRKAAESFAFGGYEIPAGSNIAYSAYVTHRIPGVWREPLRFDPERWNPAAPGYHAPTPYEYVPFGNGARRCIGSALALLEMKTLLAMVLARTELRLRGERPVPTGIAAMFPKGGVPVEVRRVG
jgi:cytochrome P450